MIRTMWLPLAVLFTVSAGCAGRPSPPAAQQAPRPAAAPADALTVGRIPISDEPPAALVQLGQSAADLFDAAGASDWGRALASLQAMNDARSSVPADLPDPDIAAKLEARMVSVRDATNNRHQLETMEAANSITQLVAELSRKYRSEVPYEVRMLGYYGRQIELGVASGNSTVSGRATTDLVTTWDRIEPEIQRRGHIDDARRFNTIVVTLVSAKQAADLSGPARDELAAARHLENIFTSPQSGTAQ
jgi:hypothetical protein